MQGNSRCGEDLQVCNGKGIANPRGNRAASAVGAHPPAFPCCCASPRSYYCTARRPRRRHSCQSTHSSGLICRQYQLHTWDRGEDRKILRNDTGCGRCSLSITYEWLCACSFKNLTFTYIMTTSPELAEPAITVIHHFPSPSSLYFPWFYLLKASQVF